VPGPARERRTDALRCHHLGLTIEREMMVELGYDDMRECGEGRATTRDGFDGRGRLHDLLAEAAATLAPDRPHDAPCERGDIELVGIPEPAAVREPCDAEHIIAVDTGCGRGTHCDDRALVIGEQVPLLNGNYIIGLIPSPSEADSPRGIPKAAMI
jgi:hypothetical protein